jgi:hypothetical protein
MAMQIDRDQFVENMKILQVKQRILIIAEVECLNEDDEAQRFEITVNSVETILPYEGKF